MANEFIARNGIIAKSNTVITGSLKVSGSGITVTGSVAVSGSLNGNTYQLNGDGSGYLASNNIHWNGGGDLYLDNGSLNVEGSEVSNGNFYKLDGGDGSGYFLDRGVGGTATIHWDTSGNMTWGGVDYSPYKSSITFQPESATIWLFDSNQDTLHLAPLFIQSDYFTLSNYVSFDYGNIYTNGSGILHVDSINTNATTDTGTWQLGNGNFGGQTWSTDNMDSSIFVTIDGYTYLIPAQGQGQ